MNLRSLAALALVCPALLLPACGKKKEPAAGAGPAASMTPPPPPVSDTAPIAAGSVRFGVANGGTASFLIDAPSKKIKGRSNVTHGTLVFDRDLTKASGEVVVDLDGIRTETFSDPDKNASQTEHAHNWFEIGKDVPAARRDDYRMARFTIRGVDSAEPAKLADAPEQDGVRTVSVTAHGDFRLHAITVPKTVKLKVAFTGPPDAPVVLHLTTVEPLTVSLSGHDVKPRDAIGSFLNGALKKVGKKIDDKVQVSLDLRAAIK